LNSSVLLSPPPSPESLRDALRTATAARHHALDRALAGAFSSVAAYARYLRAIGRATAPIERVVVAHGLVESGGRIEAIGRDLRALVGVASDLERDGWGPETFAEAAGAAYVLEGSTLGGLVLARDVEARLRVGATAFLRLRGTGTAAAWQRFVGRLESWGADATPTDRGSAERGATLAFQAFADALVAEGVIAEVPWPMS
jgi:heme oxygenase